MHRVCTLVGFKNAIPLPYRASPLEKGDILLALLLLMRKKEFPLFLRGIRRSRGGFTRWMDAPEVFAISAAQKMAPRNDDKLLMF
jgi:hypothetical protein